MPMDLSPLILSLKIALTALSIVFLLGVGMARLSMNLQGRMKWFLDVLFTLPLVLPPTVIGFILLVLFGKKGLNLNTLK